MNNFTRAAQLLWAPIPYPARPKPKKQKTWKTLDVGRRLRLVGEKMYIGGRYHEAGSLYAVTQVNSLGVLLRAELTEGEECVIHWGREWKGTFEKVKKGRGKG